jgi:DnaK suppressor protein
MPGELTMPQATPETRAELLAMPASDYMNPQQLAFFRQLLESMAEAILDNADSTSAQLREGEVFADINDRATQEEENQLEQRVRDRERKLLKKIRQALARIDDSSYGWCRETGERIGLPRLLARPTAEYSIEAQERHERHERLSGA